MVAIQKIGAQIAAIVVVVDGDRQLGVATIVPNANAISKTSVVSGIVLVVVNVNRKRPACFLYCSCYVADDACYVVV